VGIHDEVEVAAGEMEDGIEVARAGKGCQVLTQVERVTHGLFPLRE
jgi:hypothetical protein